MVLFAENQLKKIVLLLTSFFLLAGNNSCTKPDTATSGLNNNPTQPTPAFNTTINGSDPGNWSVTGTTNSGFIIIDATCAGGITVGLQISATSTGKYTLGGPGGNSGVYGTSSPSTSYATTGTSPYTGTLLISVYNPSTKTISGTFSFEAQEKSPGTTGTVKITGGSFSNVVW
ncbi:MAG TPA: DUF6252 family protein [Bacteroidia bacterium]|nr:DUF6252 family protein [Bacteroidia bacterium]